MALVRTRSIFTLAEHADGIAVFRRSLDEGETDTHFADGMDVAILDDIWHEMGRPQQLSVTIEPGDTLRLVESG
jgi:hypothetical protein